MEKVRLGIIGVGGIANHAHIPGLEKCENAEIVAVCDIDEQRLNQTGDRLHIDPARRFRDYRALIACGDVEAVEICTPNYLHVPIALEVVRAGKKLNVEKPLALSGREAQTLADALRARGDEAMMCFSYRFYPAVRYAKHLLEQGALGQILGVQVEYLKDSALWPDRKLEWRFIKEYAGTGVLGDLGVHLIDMTRLLAGDFRSVCSRLGTVITERPREDGSGMGKVETDDYCSFLAELEGNVNAVFNITRCAKGHRNTIRFEIYGMKGAMAFDLNHRDILSIACADLFPDHPEMHEVQVPEEFSASQEQTFVDFVQGKKGRWFPSVEDGVACQRVLDALERSAAERRWVDVEG